MVKIISYLWLASLAGAGAAFFSQVVIARQLSVADFGVFSSAMATVALVTPLAGFGIAAYWLKVFGQEGWKATRWLKSSISFVVMSTLLVLFLLSVWAMLGPHDLAMRKLLLLLSFYMVGQVFIELVSARLQLEERYIGLALWQSIPHFMRLLLIVVFIYFFPDNLNLYSIAYMYIVVVLLISLISIYSLWGMFQGRFFLKGHGAVAGSANNLKQENSTLSSLVVECWPFGMAGVFYLIYFQSDIVLLKYLSGAETAGIYNVAFLVMGAVYLLPSVAYQKFLLPKLHRWAHNDRVRLYKTFRVGNIIMLGLGIVAMLLLWVVVPWVVPLLFGVEYKNTIPLLMILSLAAPVRFLATSVGAMLTTKEYMQKKVKYMGVVAILNIMLNIMLIPTFSAHGAAVATVISEFVLLIIYWFSVKANVFTNLERKANVI